MTGGWFVGQFEPNALYSKECEVAIKTYSAGQKEPAHFHKLATELTVIVSGRVRMMNKEWGPGDILVLAPGEVTDFEALTDVVNVVVKTPSAPNDKFLASTY